jgi:hypothetical protein
LHWSSLTEILCSEQRFCTFTDVKNSYAPGLSAFDSIVSPWLMWTNGPYGLELMRLVSSVHVMEAGSPPNRLDKFYTQACWIEDTRAADARKQRDAYISGIYADYISPRPFVGFPNTGSGKTGLFGEVDVSFSALCNFVIDTVLFHSKIWSRWGSH